MLWKKLYKAAICAKKTKEGATSDGYIISKCIPYISLYATSPLVSLHLLGNKTLQKVTDRLPQNHCTHSMNCPLCTRAGASLFAFTPTDHWLIELDVQEV